MRNQGQLRLRVGLAGAAILCTCTSPAILAQVLPGTADQTALEEIVVTARGWEEQLVNVPAAVTAFTTQKIEDSRIDQVKDFISLTPNVNITQSESAGFNAIAIRGITQVRNSEAPVSVVVDGVPQMNSRQFTQELFDIESIQVLRGPQGALYGRNATGGAILITTKDPGDELNGNVKVGFGSGDESSVEASINGPIVPGTLSFRLGGKYLDRDGYFENVFRDEKQDSYRDSTLRGLLLWTPSETFTARLAANHGNTRAGGALSFHFQQALINPDGTLNDFDFSIPGDPNLVDRKWYSNNPGRDERDIDDASLHLSWDLPSATFSAITGYSRMAEYTDGDADPQSASVDEGINTQYFNVNGWSQELRLTSDVDKRLRWMIGAYYLDVQRFVSTSFDQDLGLGIEKVYKQPNYSSTVSPTITFLGDDNDNEDVAGFGSVAYDIVPDLEVNVALRYDRETREQHVSDFNTSGEPGAVNHATFEKWQPKATISWRPEGRLNVYGSYGVGFRAGLFNQNGVAEIAEAAGIQGVSDLVPQEETATAELGFKAEAWNRRLAFNAALFSTDVENQQYFVFIPAVGAQVLVPIDKVRLQGGEVELTARVADGLDLGAAIGITDSEIRSYSVNPDAVGNKAPYVPEMTVNLNAQYRTSLTDRLGLFSLVEYRGLGEQYWNPENSAARSYVSLVDARLGVESADQKWSVIASIENAFDESYNAEFIDLGEIEGLGFLSFATPAAPRVWRVDVEYRF